MNAALFISIYIRPRTRTSHFICMAVRDFYNPRQQIKKDPTLSTLYKHSSMTIHLHFIFTTFSREALLCMRIWSSLSTKGSQAKFYQKTCWYVFVKIILADQLRTATAVSCKTFASATFITSLSLRLWLSKKI